VENSALQHALELQRRLRFGCGVAFWHQRPRGVHKVGGAIAQAGESSPARAQYLRGNRVAEERQQKMLYRHEFMTVRTRAFKGLIQRELKVFTQHPATSTPRLETIIRC